MRNSIRGTLPAAVGRDVLIGARVAVVTESGAGRTTTRTPAGTSLRSTLTITEDVDRRL